jgi:hypothetical protein
MDNRRLNIIYEATSPISHGGDETLSNISPFRRSKMNLKGKIIDLPVVTGNSIRGVWRRLGMIELLKLIELEKDSLNIATYHLLFTGGSLTAGSEDTQTLRKREIREILPFLSIFGSAITNDMLAGKLSSGILYPVSFETEEITSIPEEKSIYEFISTEFFTRKDDFEEDEKTGTNQMIYETEVMIAGTKFFQDVTLKNVNEIEQGAFFHMLEIFQKNSVIGGKNNVGHGRIKFDFDFEKERENINKYVNFVIENKEKIKDYIITKL